MRFYEYNKLLKKNGVSITYSGLKHLGNHFLFDKIEVV